MLHRTLQVAVLMVPLSYLYTVLNPEIGQALPSAMMGIGLGALPFAIATSIHHRVK